MTKPASTQASLQKLKNTLDTFYREYDFRQRMLHDPIEFPHRYRKTGDIEVAAFLASSFAYGKVTLFKPVVEKILNLMGRSPSDFLLNVSIRRESKRFEGIQYRFNKNEDILCLLLMLQTILKEEGSLKNAFMRHYRSADADIGSALAGMVEALLAVNTSVIYGSNARPAGLLQFLPSPAQGSACKRLCLYLRWMVRDRDIDFGIWKEVGKDRLVIPVDTHIMRISRCLGFTKRKAANWKTAVEITRALKQFDPQDPLRYDFALCHHGISGICRGEKDRSVCSECIFRNF